MQSLTLRFKEKYIVWILAALSISFLLSLAAMQIFAAILILLYLSEKFINKKIAFGKIETAFSIFVLARIISIIFSEHPQLSNQAYYKDAIYILGFYAFSFYFKCLNITSIKKVITIFIYSAVFVSIIGIFLFITGAKERAASITSGYATYSGYLLCALAILLFTKFYSKKYDWLIWSVNISILMIGIILALGRGDFAVGIFLIITAILFKKFSLKEFSIVLILTTVISLAAFSINTKEISGRVENPGGLSDRNVLWSRAYELSDENPIIGFGPRTFKNIFLNVNKLSDKNVASWHNDYITIYIESGIIGISAFIILVIMVYVYSLITLRKFNRIDYEYNLLLGVLLSITGMLMSAFLSGFINNPILSILFSFQIAILSSLNFKSLKLNS